MKRTYSYAAKAAIVNRDLVHQQLLLAYRYRYDRTGIARDEWYARDAIRAPHIAAGEKKPRYTEAEKAEFNRLANEAKEAAKAARNASGLYWGTYLCADDALKRSADSTWAKPSIPPFDGTGALAVQIQKGMPVARLLAGTDTRARITGTGKHRELHLRVGSEPNGEPKFAVFPLVYHRDLPPEATVTWVKIVLRRIGCRYKHYALFSLEKVQASLPPPIHKCAVAIDVGWRKLDTGIRVATWVDENGNSGRLRIPLELIGRWKKTEDLQSIRDKNFDAALEALCDARRTQEAQWPADLMRQTQYTHQWESPERLGALAKRWVGKGIPALDALDQWRRQDKHLLIWQSHQRENVLLARREAYRLFALEMAKYETVVVEHLDLRDFAELPDEDAGDKPDRPVTKKARPTRFKIALSQFFGCLTDAVTRAGGKGVEVEPAWTTQTCSKCGQQEPFDAAVEVAHTCSHCGATWDQDTNAAENLLRALRCGATWKGRSRFDVPDEATVSKAAAARAAGLKKWREERSKKAVQTAETPTET